MYIRLALLDCFPWPTRRPSCRAASMLPRLASCSLQHYLERSSASALAESSSTDARANLNEVMAIYPQWS